MLEINKMTYVILLNYNGWRDTVECLESVLESDCICYHVVVVDNCSSDGSVEHMLHWASSTDIDVVTIVKHSDAVGLDREKGASLTIERKDSKKVLNDTDQFAKRTITLIRAPKNGGFAYGNNIGIEFALGKGNCEYLWLLNNDTVIFPDTLRKLLVSFNEKRKLRNLGVLGNVQRYYHAPEKVQAIGGAFDKWRARVWNVGAGLDFVEGSTKLPHHDYVYGASMLISHACITRVGLLNEQYFMYFEELDYAERARRAGFDLAVCSSVSILHKYRSTVAAQGEEFRERHFRKSLIQFYKNYHPYLAMIPIMKLLLITFVNLFRGRRFESLYLRIVKESILSYFR